MPLTEDELWKQIWNYDVCRIQGNILENPNIIEKRTSKFVFFNNNLNRALFLYPSLLNLEKEEDFINLHYQFFCETVLINLITSLEVYLRDIFRFVSTEIPIKKVDMKKFIKFIKEFTIQDNYFKALEKYGNHDVPLSEVIPSRMDFQQKDKSKTAYNLLSIYLPEIVDKKQETWDRIFGKPNGYIQIRNKIMHNGSIISFLEHETIDIELINNATLDIVKFVYNLDEKIKSEYPKKNYPKLYFQPVPEK